MPVHDWTLVGAGLFHHFHQRWIAALGDALNFGGLPRGYFALGEQVSGGPIPDVVTLHNEAPPTEEDGATGVTAVALATAPVRATYIRRAEGDIYARKANRVAIHHPLGRVVAVIEIVSPGNKSSQNALRAFVTKAVELLDQGIHLVLVDLFPPNEKRDPQGIHKAIWDEIEDYGFVLPADRPLTVASYSAGMVKVAYVEPVAVGMELPSLPLFLEPERYVPTPLEATYQATWNVFPPGLRRLLNPPETPPQTP
jgi:hypothetical protein